MNQVLGISRQNPSMFGSFVLFVFSHGADYSIASTRKEYSLTANNIILSSDMYVFDCNSLFRYIYGTGCPSLSGKPKLFFLDVCRGTR